MFGIGLPELILIMAVALIVVGPEKLPDIAKSLAKGMVELKKAASGLRDSLNEDDSPAWHEVKPETDPKLMEAYNKLPENARPPESTVASSGVQPPVAAGDDIFEPAQPPNAARPDKTIPAAPQPEPEPKNDTPA